VIAFLLTATQVLNEGRVRRLMKRSQDEKLMRSVIRLNGVILGLVAGIMVGLGIFVATNWLVIRGGPNVGLHLQLLSQYFLGYSVSFVGSFIGMVYGFVTGYVLGWFIAFIYNSVLWLRKS